MAFEKGNKLSSGRPAGSKNKKTIVKESFAALEEVGIDPLKISNELITSLVQQTDLRNTEKLSLLSTMTSLFKYQLLTRSEEVKFDELLEINDELEQENKMLKDVFVGDAASLLAELKKGE